MTKFGMFSTICFLILVLLIPGLAFGQITNLKCVQGTTLAWAPNDEPDLTGYRLYNADSPSAFQDMAGKVPLATIPASAPRVNDKIQYKPLLNSLVAEKMNFFDVTAYDAANNESGPSNAVSCNNDQAPKAPTGLTIE